MNYVSISALIIAVFSLGWHISTYRQMNDLRSLTALQIEQNGLTKLQIEQNGAFLARVTAEMDRREAAEREWQEEIERTKKYFATKKHRSIDEILGLDLD